MILLGTIVAALLAPRHVSDRVDRDARRQRLCHQGSTRSGADRSHIVCAVALDRRPALCDRSHLFPRLGADRGLARAVLAEIVAAARSTGLRPASRPRRQASNCFWVGAECSFAIVDRGAVEATRLQARRTPVYRGAMDRVYKSTTARLNGIASALPRPRTSRSRCLTRFPPSRCPIRFQTPRSKKRSRGC